MGQGSYGFVVKAMHKETKQLCAIKLMKNIFSDVYQARKTLREIKILRKLSRIPNNLFTTQLLDIILPVEFDQELRAADGSYNFNFKNQDNDNEMKTQ